MPDCTAIFSGCPATKAPIDTKSGLPNNNTKVAAPMGSAYFISIWGSIIIPTDTKKIAPKRVFIDWVSCSIFSAFVVSAKIEPMIKAPSAEENPTYVANTTIMKQNARDIINRVSSLINNLTFLKKVGMKNIPDTNHRIRKKANFKTSPIISPPEKVWLTATV